VKADFFISPALAGAADEDDLFLKLMTNSRFPTWCRLGGGLACKIGGLRGWRTRALCSLGGGGSWGEEAGGRRRFVPGELVFDHERMGMV